MARSRARLTFVVVLGALLAPRVAALVPPAAGRRAQGHPRARRPQEPSSPAAATITPGAFTFGGGGGRALAHGGDFVGSEQCCNTVLGCSFVGCDLHGFTGCGAGQYQYATQVCTGCFQHYRCSACRDCPAGRHKADSFACTQEGIEACDTICAPGTHFVTGDTGSCSGVDAACPAGYWCPGDGRRHGPCASVGAGKLGRAGLAGQASEAEACQGACVPADAPGGVCCAPGIHYVAGVAGSTTSGSCSGVDAACPAGYWCAGDGSRRACPAGRYGRADLSGEATEDGACRGELEGFVCEAVRPAAALGGDAADAGDEGDTGDATAFVCNRTSAAVLLEGSTPDACLSDFLACAPGLLSDGDCAAFKNGVPMLENSRKCMSCPDGGTGLMVGIFVGVIILMLYIAYRVYQSHGEALLARRGRLMVLWTHVQLWPFSSRCPSSGPRS